VTTNRDASASLSLRAERALDWVTIDRAHDRNALDSRTLAELGDHLTEAEARGVRAVVYRGAGEEHFIGGADGVEMYRFCPDEAGAFSRRIQELFDRMESSPILLVAAIDGLCFGGGLEFALACDIRIATPRSRLGLPEVKLGIIPGGGGTQRLPRAIGMSRAKELILTGRLISSDEALAIGLIHSSVSPEQLDAEAGAYASRATRLPLHAFREAKQVTQAAWDRSLAEGLRLEAEAFGRCFQESDFSDCVREQLESGALRTTQRTDGRGSPDGNDSNG